MANEEVLKEIVFRELSKRGLVDKIETSGAQGELIPNPNQTVNQTVSNISSDFVYQLKGENSNLADIDDVIDKNAKKLTKEEYKTLITDDKFKNKPLPKTYYVDQKSGLAFLQAHLRGLLPEDVKKWKDGKLSFVELIKNHSLHCDLRLQFKGLPKLVQYVITESDVESYIRGLTGAKNPNQKGYPSPQKVKIISKPSSEPPDALRKSEDEKEVGKLLDEKGAKIMDNYIIKNRSFIIPAGEVGATGDKDAYLGLVWIGTAIEGVQREDLHELFFYPDSRIPEINRKLLNGRFIIRCFKTSAGRTWWMFKATDTENPMNPTCHLDFGYHYLLPEEKVKYFGHEEYPQWKQRKEYC